MGEFFLKLFRAFLTRKIWVVGIFSTLFLVSKIAKDFYSVELWLKFEPQEKYLLEGNRFFLKDQSKVAFYNEVSDMFQKNNQDNQPVSKQLLWSELGERSENALGLKLSWDRLGNHFVDVIPPAEINFKDSSAKSIEEISLWVWSGNYQHRLVAVFSKEDGEEVIVPLTKLDFLGWNKVVTKLPKEIKIDSKDAYFADGEFYFDRFRIYTHEREKVGNIYVFLDNFEVKKNLYRHERYDGKNLVGKIKEELGIGSYRRQQLSTQPLNQGNSSPNGAGNNNAQP